FGVDLRKQTDDEVVTFLQGRSAPREIQAALDVWLASSEDAAERQRLQAIAARLDPSGAPLRQRFRVLIARHDWDGLKRLAAGPEALRLPPTDLPAVGLALVQAGGGGEGGGLVRGGAGAAAPPPSCFSSPPGGRVVR